MRKSFILFTILIAVLAIAVITEKNSEGTLNDNLMVDADRTTVLLVNETLGKD